MIPLRRIHTQFVLLEIARQTGATICWSPYAMMSDELAEQYVVVPCLTAPDGSGFVKSGRRNDFLGTRTGFAITSACENPERLLQWWDYLQTEYPPNRMVDSSDLETRTFMETDLFAYLENFTASSIMNGVDDAAWQAHLDALQSWQYYDWIQWYQDYIDGNV